MPEQMLSHYCILEKLGSGGMGEVYLARDTILDRKVAIKLLPPDSTTDARARSRLFREARAAAKLDHPNICTIHEVAEVDGKAFIVMQFVDGESLASRLQKKPLELTECLDIAVQIADALAEAHSRGIVHRDIKPANVMLAGRNHVKVTDFGLAKVIPLADPSDTRAPTESLLKGPGAIVGTVPYMSPEQVKGEPLDTRTDIFSFGAVLYEMVSGQRPFGNDSSGATLSAILTKEPPPVARFARDAPAELERITTKTLRKDREERYQHAKDLLIDLRHLKGEMEFAAKLEHSASPDIRDVQETQIHGGATSTTAPAAAPTDRAETTAAKSSVEYLAGRIRRHKRAAFLALAMLAAATAAIYFAFLARHESGATTDSISSIAVLPFVNESGNADLDYLSDGFSESLIDRLSQLPQLKVIARNSSFKYRERDVDLDHVARVLDVQAIVTGTVAQRGDRLSVRVDVVDVRENKQLWGEQFSRPAIDAQAVQEEIARTVSEKLQLRLSGAQQKQLARYETANPAAYELLLRGRFYNNKVGTENRKKAVEYFQQALAVDPNYALAYAELCTTYINLVGFSSFDPKEYMPKAEAAALKARELDGDLAEVAYAVAATELYSWQWANAEYEYKHAIELNPNLARAHNGYAMYLSLMGRHDEAIAQIKRARELDPLSSLINLNIGTILYSARRYDEAIEAFRKTLELDRDNAFAHFQLGAVHAAQANYAAALAAYQEAIKLGEGTPRTQIYLGAAYAMAGQREQARAILKRLETGTVYVSPAHLAILQAALGERERAFASLEASYADHDVQLQYLKANPAYDGLRDDPRFQDILRRVGLAQ